MEQNKVPPRSVLLFSLKIFTSFTCDETKGDKDHVDVGGEGADEETECCNHTSDQHRHTVTKFVDQGTGHWT